MLNPKTPREPGDRSGLRVDNSFASPVADVVSNEGGKAGTGGGSGPGFEMLKASTSRGSPTSSHVPR